MARFMEPTSEQELEYRTWVASRPPNVRAVAEHFDIWTLYRLKSSNHRVVVQSFSEHKDGSVTLKVRVSGQFNTLLFERDVFGVHPDELEPCDLPAPDEIVGAALTQDEVEQNLDKIRELVLGGKGQG